MRTRARFISAATLRALTTAHDAMMCVGMGAEAASIVEGVHNGASVVETVRAFQVAEWHAVTMADEAGDALAAHRARVCADACGHAVRLLLTDYERAAERAA